MLASFFLKHNVVPNVREDSGTHDMRDILVSGVSSGWLPYWLLVSAALGVSGNAASPASLLAPRLLTIVAVST
jgi:hypothetical protein